MNKLKFHEILFQSQGDIFLNEQMITSEGKKDDAMIRFEQG